MRRNHHFQNLE